MPPTDDKLDRQAILDRASNDYDVLTDIIQIFHEQVPQMFADLRNAIEVDDASRVEKTAHYFKSSIGNFTSGYSFEIVFRLEEMGRRGDLTGAEAELIKLETAVAKLQTSLENLLQEWL